LGIDALAWAQRAQELGAGEICLNSIDADGTCEGYELNLTALVSGHVTIPVIASGGAGKPEHLRDVLTEDVREPLQVAVVLAEQVSGQVVFRKREGESVVVSNSFRPHKQDRCRWFFVPTTNTRSLFHRTSHLLFSYLSMFLLPVCHMALVASRRILPCRIS
jgi:hypothetical protein